ncbi:endonuclease/exonuclease/phosphatase family protein [Actinacidiphila glaucinigra]|uniref:endonuclease/exonuclease/phosphatase family protein n=1 Tax=Actinacidiphila glaucinigra TaxID=235986 RepID=UPI0033B89AF7
MRSAGKTGTRTGTARRNRNPPEAPAGDHRQAGGNLRPIGRRGCQCTHLAASSQTDRLQQTPQIVDLIGDKEPAVLVGDFNALPDAPESQPLQSRYTDAWAAQPTPPRPRRSASTPSTPPATSSRSSPAWCRPTRRPPTTCR